MSGGWGRLSGVQSFAVLELTQFVDFGTGFILVLVDRDGVSPGIGRSVSFFLAEILDATPEAWRFRAHWSLERLSESYNMRFGWSELFSEQLSTGSGSHADIQTQTSRLVISRCGWYGYEWMGLVYWAQLARLIDIRRFASLWSALNNDKRITGSRSLTLQVLQAFGGIETGDLRVQLVLVLVNRLGLLSKTPMLNSCASEVLGLQNRIRGVEAF